ncbi:MAG: DUF433 domain-containing protein [Candidatus Kariarchaeaceae archaeon]
MLGIIDRIIIDPKILTGKAVIKGTRISVEFILELLAKDWTYEMILENYPQLTKEDILAVLNYARIVIQEETVHPVET